MQAVVHCIYLFRDVVIGWPGSVHDARVFSNSAIFKKGNEQKLFPNDVKKEICGVDIPPVLLADILGMRPPEINRYLTTT